MKISAGAAASICFAKVGLAAYEVVVSWPLSRRYAALTSSSASLRLAAAKITSLFPCAEATALQAMLDRIRRGQTSEPRNPGKLSRRAIIFSVSAGTASYSLEYEGG